MRHHRAQTSDPLAFGGARLAGSLGLAFVLAACGGSERTDAPASTGDGPEAVESTAAASATPEGPLEPLPRPALESLDDDARAAVARELEAVGSQIANATPADRARAWGRLGMTLHAVGLTADATPCYRNVRRLGDSDARWAYLEGRIAFEEGRTSEALALFEHTTERDGRYLPAHVLAGEILLEQARVSDAQRKFRRALELDGNSARALVGLGRVALLEDRPAEARTLFTRALDVAPGANSIHYLLSRAVRALGDTAAADDYLARRGEVRAGLTDPYLEDVRALGTGARGFERTGMDLVHSGRFAEAAEAFAKAAASDPADTESMFFAAMARLRTGDVAGAERDLKRAIERDPDNPRAHAALANLLAHRGEDDAAIAAYRTTLRLDPSSADSHAGIATALMRTGEPASALEHYERTIELRPAHGPARLGRALARVRLSRWREAIAGLEDDLAVFPDQPAFAHIVARLMASAPDAAVRDGARALELSNELSDTIRSAEIGETLAMAYAEVGRFDAAVELQRDVLRTAHAAGDPHAVRRMEANLARYSAAEPCREPWPDDDPVFVPARPPLPGGPS